MKHAKPGDRVTVMFTDMDGARVTRVGTIVYRNMAPPTYSEPRAFSVKLDGITRPGYEGSMFPANQVTLISEEEK